MNMKHLNHLLIVCGVSLCVCVGGGGFESECVYTSVQECVLLCDCESDGV